MRKIALMLLTTCTLLACNKDTTTTPANNNNNGGNSSGCPDGHICFTLDGTDMSKQAGGYYFADTFLFVKHEDGNAQLSLDIFGTNTGTYNVTDVRKSGNARIYYFPNGSTGDMFIAEMGTFNVTAYDAANKKVSGTFSATLHDYDNNNSKFLKTKSVTITKGEFKNVSVPK